MAEIMSDVFDIFHPTPVPLRELSAMVISLEIWHCEINKYRSSNTLKEFHPSGELISLKTILILDLPSMIYSTINKYVKIFGDSMKGWLREHHSTVFKFQYVHETCILEYFRDFVYDYDGTIHYERTAKRMMQCDQFDVHQKFLIACTYCFEDDIIRIWPLGLKKTDSLYVNYSKNSHFKYWSYFLENVSMEDDSIEEEMLRDFMPLNGPSLEYFWNRVPPESRLQKAIDVFVRDLRSFVRYILPKLDHQQLDEFLKHNGCKLMYSLVKNSIYDEEFVLRTWAYVNNATNENVFTNLLTKMLECEFMGFFMRSTVESDPDDRDLENFLNLCLEVWNSAPENLKHLAGKKIASIVELLPHYPSVVFLPLPIREFKLVLAILSYATYEERNAFWHGGWHHLIFKTQEKYLHQIMKVCFQNEDEITELKKNVLANNNRVVKFCRSLLRDTYFKELNDFVSFLLPETQATRNFKQQLLQSTFLNDGFNDSCFSIVKKPKEFDEFIKDAYDSVVQSTNFKNELMSSPSVRTRLSIDALFIRIEQFTEFIETFVSTERILLGVKTHIIHFLKEEGANYKSMVPVSSFTSLLSWCLEGNEEASTLELSYL
ncbi:uncharacterized protein LOC135847975 [Planococcus citri]|uniref:uncharacterized protein LOC135847975 n=1 Tax=Planococcus citri TaxID=170843 RepID=UPI0031F9F02A